MDNILQNKRVLWLLVVLMSAAAFFRIGFEFWRLLFDADWTGANDLRTFHNGVRGWFAGRDVYSEWKGVTESAAYPPATYALLWPLLGWMNFAEARWIWAGTIALLMGWMIFQIIREANPELKQEALFVALLFLSMNATGVTIGNGQLTMHVLAPLLAGLLLWEKRSGGWIEDLLSAALLVFSTLKPTIFVPFFLLILIRSFRVRPFLFLLSGYMLLTAFSMLYQDHSFFTVFQNWLLRGSEVAQGGGYGNLYSWLSAVGKQEWALPASGIVLFLFALWAYFYRKADFWTQLGITALFARIWTYHRMYDDVLILFALIALFRLQSVKPARLSENSCGADAPSAKLPSTRREICGRDARTTSELKFLRFFGQSPASRGQAASGLLIMIALLNLARLSNISTIRYTILISAHQLLWGAVLLFLMTGLGKQSRPAQAESQE